MIVEFVKSTKYWIVFRSGHLENRMFKLLLVNYNNNNGLVLTTNKASGRKEKKNQ